MDTSPTDNTPTYNGWPNRDTWLVPLWIDNDEATYIQRVDMLTSHVGPVLAYDAFRIGVTLWNGTDEIDWNAVNWSAIAHHWELDRLWFKEDQ